MIVVVAALASIHVLAAGHCPASPAVEERLAGLLRQPSSPTEDSAVVDETTDAITVELRTAAGKTIARRTLPATGSCDERADAVAVTVASWEAQFAPDAGRALSLPAPEVAVVQTQPRPSHLQWSAEVAFLGSVAGGAFAAGASGEVFLGKKQFPLAARVGLVGIDTRSLTVGPGHASWNRVALVLGPTYEAISKYVHLDIHADVVAGWLFLQGQGYGSNHGDNAFDPGLGGGVRLSLARWDITPWIDVTLLGWLRTQTASATEAGTTVSAEVPRFDVWMRAGFAYGRRR